MPEDDAQPTVQLRLWKDAALVLFEWIHRIEEEGRFKEIVQDSAQVVALWALSGGLESELAEPFDPNYRELLQAASRRLVEGQDPDPLSLY